MAVSLDASTPSFSSTPGGTNVGSLVTSGASFGQTSASFTPPSSSLVAVAVVVNYDNQPGYTSLGVSVADSHSNSYALSPAWAVNTDHGFGSASIFWHYYASSPGSTTVTATLAAAESDTSGSAISIATLVFDGPDSNQAGAGYNVISDLSSTLDEEITVTTTNAGSMVVVAVANGAGTAVYTPESGTTTYGAVTTDPTGNSLAFGRSTSATGTPGSTSFGWTLGATSQSYHDQIVALEILPAGAHPSSSALLAGFP